MTAIYRHNNNGKLGKDISGEKDKNPAAQSLTGGREAGEKKIRPAGDRAKAKTGALESKRGSRLL